MKFTLQLSEGKNKPFPKAQKYRTMTLSIRKNSTVMELKETQHGYS